VLFNHKVYTNAHKAGQASATKIVCLLKLSEDKSLTRINDMKDGKKLKEKMSVKKLTK
jgi:hypothetical protein